MSYDYLFKILIIGDSGVGKSRILERYSDNTFTEGDPTIGVDFKVRTVEVGDDGAKAKLQLWDTAGQERFRSITTTYYRGAHGAMIVFDVGKRSSMLSLRKWFEELRVGCSDFAELPVCVIANKSDIPEEQWFASKEAITLAIINIFLEYKKAPCITFTSAKRPEGLGPITKAFSILAERIFTSGIKYPKYQPSTFDGKSSTPFYRRCGC